MIPSEFRLYIQWQWLCQLPVVEWVEGILQVVQQPGEEGVRHGDLVDRDKVAVEH